MRMHRLLVIAAVLVLPLRDARAQAASAAGDEPATYVNISIVNSTIGPLHDGHPWDGPDEALVKDLVSAILSAVPAGHAGAAKAVTAFSKRSPMAQPDAYGSAKLLADGEWSEPVALASRKRPQKHTLQPSWPADPGWKRIRLTHETRVQIHLEDKDLVHDDPIGDVELNYDAIASALSTGGIYQVPTSEQTHGQILFVGLSVTSASAPKPPAAVAAR